MDKKLKLWQPIILSLTLRRFREETQILSFFKWNCMHRSFQTYSFHHDATFFQFLCSTSVRNLWNDNPRNSCFLDFGVLSVISSVGVCTAPTYCNNKNHHSLSYFLHLPVIITNKPPLLLGQTQRASLPEQQRISPRKQEPLHLCLYKHTFKLELGERWILIARYQSARVRGQ